MLSLSRGPWLRGRLFRLGALALSLSLVTAVGTARPAYADDGDDEEDSGDDGGDDSSAGKGDEGDDGEEEEDAKDQPPVTSGGLFTMRTYPVREISRPLTMTEKIAQVRLGLGTDISAKGAFGTFGVSLEAIYGQSDNFSLIGGFTNAYNMKQFGFYAGFEGALAYDMVDIRLALNAHRNAIANFQNFCSPVATADPTNPSDPAMCAAPGAALVNLPDGTYQKGGTKFSIDLGFPFRYAIKPEIAIVALQTLMSIDFNAVSRDHTIQNTSMEPDGMGGMRTVVKNIPAPNSAKPDLNPSIGIATNPVPPLSVVIFAQLRIPDFDTSAGAFQVPVTGRVEFSPNQKFDIGLEFTLLNVKPPEGQSPIDNRFLTLFLQTRVGR